MRRLLPLLFCLLALAIAACGDDDGDSGSDDGDAETTAQKGERSESTADEATGGAPTQEGHPPSGGKRHAARAGGVEGMQVREY